MTKKSPLISPSLVAVLGEGFFSRLSFGMVGFTLPLYANKLGMGVGAIGVLISLSVMAEMVLKPIAAPLADRFGAKPALGTAVGLRSVVVFLFALASAPWQLFAIRALHGASESLRDPSVNVLISEHGGKETIASAFAWYSTGKQVAGAVGRSAAGILLTLTGANYSAVFLTAFVVSALPLFIVTRFVEGSNHRAPVESPGIEDLPQAPAQPQTKSPMPAEVKSMVRRSLGFGVLATGTATMLSNLFPLLATTYAGLTAAEAGIVYLVSVLVVLFAGPLFGWLSDNVSRKLVLSVRGVANTVSSILYILFPSFWGVMVARIMDDAGKAAYRPAWGELMARIASTDKTRRARIMGYMSLSENIGETTGPILAGFLWQAWGLPVMLAVRAILAVVTELYALLVMRSLKPKDGDRP